eukprot:6210725-Alexandrium_andersonii.AAC.1
MWLRAALRPRATVNTEERPDRPATNTQYCVSQFRYCPKLVWAVFKASHALSNTLGRFLANQDRDALALMQ